VSISVYDAHTNMRRINITIILVVFLMLTLLSGCGEENASAPEKTIDGATLFGLVDGREFEYFQEDTVTTFTPTYQKIIRNSQRSISISGADQDWVFSENEHPLINLKLASQYILQNGFWADLNGGDSLYYISEPPIVMKRALTAGTTWSGYTPQMPTQLSMMYLNFFFANFGFYYDRTYVGTEAIIVPAGSYTAHRFDVSIYTKLDDTVSAAEIREYYVASIGLVKFVFDAPGYYSSISMISYH
jgi:hypothetical protein